MTRRAARLIEQPVKRKPHPVAVTVLSVRVQLAGHCVSCGEPLTVGTYARVRAGRLIHPAC